MPASAATRRIQLEIGYNGREIKDGVSVSQRAIRDLANEVALAKNQFALGALSADQFADQLVETRNRAVELANGINRSSDEYRELTGVASQAENQLNRFGQSTTKATSAVDLLKGGIAALGISFGVQEVVRFGGEIGRMAEQADRSKQAVIALAGSVSEANKFIAAIEGAGQGGISQLQATDFAARSLALGLADTSQEAAQFTRTVTILGAAVGKDAAESFDQLQLALANLSYERLDSLGIAADKVRQRVSLLKKEGYETSAAFQIAVLAEAATTVGQLEAAGFDATTSTQELNTAWTNLSLTMGNLFTPAYQGSAQALADGLTYINQNIDGAIQLAEAFSYITSLGTIIPRTAIETFYDMDAATQKNISSIYKADTTVKQYTDGVRDSSAIGELFGNTLLFVGDAADVAAGGINRADAILGGFTGTMANAIGIADSLGGALYRLAAAQAAQSPQNGLDFARTQLGFAQNAFDSSSTLSGRINAFAGIVEAQNEVGNAEEQVRAENDRTKEAYKRNKMAEVRAAQTAGRAITSAANKAASEQERLLREQEQRFQAAYNRMGGFVDQALQFDTSVNEDDFLLDKFGLRNQNASSELVRQLQDVADRASEGMRSRFLDENPLFAFLDDSNLELIKAKAIATIRAIQDEGKYFELIPFDKFLQDVREIEAAAERRNAFRAQAISALGVGSTAAVDKALGIEGEGAESGTALAQNIVATLESGIEAEQARFRAAGVLGASFFEDGFNGRFRGIVQRMLTEELNALTQEIAA